MMLERGDSGSFREPQSGEWTARQPTAREPLWRDVVGEVLREERQARERTLQDVADVARISMPYLSEIERGRKEASSEVLAAATRALGISMTELLVRIQRRLVDYEHAAVAATPVPTATATAAPAASAAVASASVAAARGVQNRATLCLAA